MSLELTFVTAEEAAKWPDGIPIVMAKPSKHPIRGRFPTYEFRAKWEPSRAMAYARTYTHFARLPDALPEVERNG